MSPRTPLSHDADANQEEFTEECLGVQVLRRGSARDPIESALLVDAGPPSEEMRCAEQQHRRGVAGVSCWLSECDGPGGIGPRSFPQE